MTNEEFLRRLESALKERLPEDELKNVMDYHREYFAEAGENAANELDPPEVIAQRVLEEFHGGGTPPKKKGIPTWVTICLIVVVAISVAVTFSKGVQKIARKVFTTREVTDVVEEAVSGTGQIEGMSISTVGDHTTVEGSLTAFTHVEVKGAVADVSFFPGDAYALFVEYGPKERWDYELNGDTLTITGSGIFNPFPVVERATISVTYPADAQLASVDVDLDVGDITVDSAKGEVCFLDTDVGDVNATNSIFVELTCGVDTGNIWVEGGYFSTLDCGSNVGDVSISGVSAGNQAKLSTDVGDIIAVLAGSSRDCSMDLETSIGDVWVDNCLMDDEYETDEGHYILECSTDVGDITVDFTGANTAETAA